jgi:hypothetical protein
MIFPMNSPFCFTQSAAIIILALCIATPAVNAGENLRGVITTKDESAPLPHTIIKLKGDQGTKKNQPNNQGTFWFAGLDYGTYELTVEMEGYCTIVRMIHLDGMPIHIRPTPLECCTGDVPTVHVYSSGMTSSNPAIHYDREFIEKFLR